MLKYLGEEGFFCLFLFFALLKETTEASFVSSFGQCGVADVKSSNAAALLLPRRESNLQ